MFQGFWVDKKCIRVITNSFKEKIDIKDFNWKNVSQDNRY